MDEEFLLIDDYGVIGNDDRCALVGRNGSIDWYCVPHIESPSVFASILDDDDGGRFAVRPATEYEASHGYVERTNVLETTFETDDGTATVTDFMPVPGSESMRDREPDDEGGGAGDGDGATDERLQQAIYRKIEGVSGTVEVDIVFEPRFDYAREPTALERTERDDIVATEAGDDGDDAATDERRESASEDDRTRDHEDGSLYLHGDIDLEIDSAD